MSLGIVIKGPEGMVLAADSRVTLFNQVPNPQVPGQVFVIPANFDNATKLLKVKGQTFVGAVTYGLGAMPTPDGFRTMQSFIPEFEEDLRQKKKDARLSVQEFADKLSAFFAERWTKLVNRPPANPQEEINFIVAGYDENAVYGRTFTFSVPSNPKPVEQNAAPGQFGISWGGQRDVVDRLLFGFDVGVPAFIQQTLNPPAPQFGALIQEMQKRFAAGIPYQFLPLQDSVDLAVFLIRSTIAFQNFRVALRGVGGLIEVGTITRSEGFKVVAERRIAAT